MTKGILPAASSFSHVPAALTRVCLGYTLTDRRISLLTWLKGMKKVEEGREFPCTDDCAVCFINSLVHCSAVRLIQTVNSCLSHFIGATAKTDNPVKQRQEQVKGGMKLNENTWDKIGHWKKCRAHKFFHNQAYIFFSTRDSHLEINLPLLRKMQYITMSCHSWDRFQTFTLLPSYQRIYRACVTSVQGPPVWLEARKWAGRKAEVGAREE